MNDQRVLVLAGGEGRRIGGAKQDRRLAGRSLLDHALALGRRWSVKPVLVATGGQSCPVRDVTVLADRPGLAGPLGGLAAGLRHASREGDEFLLCIPVDAPFLPRDLQARLTSALASSADAGCAYARSGGRDHPTCALWRIEAALAAIDRVRLENNLSLMHLVDTVGSVAVAWELEGDLDRFFNINSAVDLAIAEEISDGIRID